MTKAELVQKYMEQRAETVTKAQAERDVNAFLEIITDAAASGDDVIFTGYFAMKRVQRKERTTTTPQGEKVHVPARYAVKFSAGKKLLEKLNSAE